MATEWPVNSVHLRLRDVIAQKELAGQMEALERELKSIQPGHYRAAHYQVGILSIYLKRQVALRPETHTNSRVNAAAAKLVAAYTSLIDCDYHLHAGVADYATNLGVTPTHLARCCKKTCGKSALSLLNDRILFEARKLLRNSKVPVYKIAKDLGFSSAAYFARAFHAHGSLTPSQFRHKGPLVQV